LTCAEVTTLLPWLLNGTLAAEEAEELRAHLRGCADCRRELRATTAAWALFDAHPPAAEVVAHALGTAPTSPDVATHLERCAACRLEVALVREEAGDEGEQREAPAQRQATPPERAGVPAVAVFAPRAASRSGARPLLALAAAVLAVLVGAGWFLTWQRLQTTDAAAAARRAALERRVAELEAALRRPASSPVAAATPSAAPLEGERLATLERELAGLRQPQGLAVVELMSEETVLRGGESKRPSVARDRPATLLLVADGLAAGTRYRIRVAPRGDAGIGTVLWEGTTRADDSGVLALYLPAASLPRGEHLLRVLRLDGGLVASYRLAVR